MRAFIPIETAARDADMTVEAYVQLLVSFGDHGYGEHPTEIDMLHHLAVLSRIASRTNEP